MTKRQQRKMVSLAVGLALLLAANYVQAHQRSTSSQTKSTTSSTTQSSAPVNIPPGYYRVSEFVDGDTIAVDMDGHQEKVRFIGVDTPETHKPNSPVQCFGEAAAKFTADTIGNNPVRLEADPTNSNRDRYNRLLRYAYLPDGTLVNAEIIKQGYGFAYVSFPFQKMEEFRGYETSAREQNKGLWSSCDTKSLKGGREQTNDVN